MAQTTYTPRRKHWKAIVNGRIDLYKEVSRNGDTATAGSILLRDQLAHEDHYLSLVDSGWGQTIDHAIKTLNGEEKLHAVATRNNQKVASMCNEVHAHMLKLKSSEEGKNPPAWKALINSQIDQKKTETDKMWEDMRDEAIATIDEMPKGTQEPAANIFTSAISAIADFASKAIAWLKKAADAIAEWLKELAKKIQEFGQNVLDWFEEAARKVRIFSGEAATPSWPLNLPSIPRRTLAKVTPRAATAPARMAAMSTTTLTPTAATA